MAPLEPGPGKPQAMEVALGQGHGGVETDDGKQPRHVQDGLDHLLAHGGVQVVELRGVVPRKAGAVVAVIDVARLAAGLVAAAEDHGGVGLRVVVVFDLDFHAAVGGEIRAFEAVGGIGRFPARDEPLRMLDHPGRIDAHVVGHHVAGQADAVMVGAVAQIDVGRFAAEVVGDLVIEQRIGRRHGILVAAQLLDGLRGAAALPDADQPQRVHAAVGERLQFFVGDLVETANVPAVKPAQLRQPHVRALGDHHRGRHPCRIGRELLVLVHGVAEDRHLRRAGDRRPLLQAGFAAAARGFFGGAAGHRGRRVELHPDGQLFFVQNLAGNLQVAIENIANQRLPQLAHKV